MRRITAGAFYLQVPLIYHLVPPIWHQSPMTKCISPIDISPGQSENELKFLTGPFSSNYHLKLSFMLCSASAARYFNIVEKISPNDMIQKFAATAPANVQAACKSTVVNILGSLPNYALDAALITSSTKLSNLLHQMQITGYMFKNAEYQMSFIRSLKGTSITGS